MRILPEKQSQGLHTSSDDAYIFDVKVFNSRYHPVKNVEVY
jgi:hypothetical protein